MTFSFVSTSGEENDQDYLPWLSLSLLDELPQDEPQQQQQVLECSPMMRCASSRNECLPLAVAMTVAVVVVFVTSTAAASWYGKQQQQRDRVVEEMDNNNDKKKKKKTTKTRALDGKARSIDIMPVVTAATIENVINSHSSVVAAANPQEQEALRLCTQWQESNSSVISDDYSTTFAECCSSEDDIQELLQLVVVPNETNVHSWMDPVNGNQQYLLSEDEQQLLPVDSSKQNNVSVACWHPRIVMAEEKKDDDKEYHPSMPTWDVAAVTDRDLPTTTPIAPESPMMEDTAIRLLSDESIPKNYKEPVKSVGGGINETHREMSPLAETSTQVVIIQDSTLSAMTPPPPADVLSSVVAVVEKEERQPATTEIALLLDEALAASSNVMGAPDKHPPPTTTTASCVPENGATKDDAMAHHNGNNDGMSNNKYSAMEFEPADSFHDCLLARSNHKETLNEPTTLSTKKNENALMEEKDNEDSSVQNSFRSTKQTETKDVSSSGEELPDNMETQEMVTNGTFTDEANDEPAFCLAIAVETKPTTSWNVPLESLENDKPVLTSLKDPAVSSNAMMSNRHSTSNNGGLSADEPMRAIMHVETRECTIVEDESINRNNQKCLNSFESTAGTCETNNDDGNDAQPKSGAWMPGKNTRRYLAEKESSITDDSGPAADDGEADSKPAATRGAVSSESKEPAIQAETVSLGNQLLKAAGKDDLDAIKAILSNPLADVNYADEWGQTALHVAADHGSDPIVRCLLEHGADVSTADHDGISVLQAAVIAGHSETCKVLLLAGADPYQADLDGDTPVSCAVDDGSVTLKLLFSEAIEEGTETSWNDSSRHSLDYLTAIRPETVNVAAEARAAPPVDTRAQLATTTIPTEVTVD